MNEYSSNITSVLNNVREHHPRSSYIGASMFEQFCWNSHCSCISNGKWFWILVTERVFSRNVHTAKLNRQSSLRVLPLVLTLCIFAYVHAWDSLLCCTRTSRNVLQDRHYEYATYLFDECLNAHMREIVSRNIQNIE